MTTVRIDLPRIVFQKLTRGRLPAKELVVKTKENLLTLA